MPIRFRQFTLGCTPAPADRQARETLCAKVDAPMDHPIELVHFTAEAGKVYYFRGRVVPPQSGVYLFFERSDIDEAQYLLSSYSLSVSQIKK